MDLLDGFASRIIHVIGLSWDVLATHSVHAWLYTSALHLVVVVCGLML